MIRTSRRPTTRCSAPSIQRFARSGPNARYRPGGGSKSYGWGGGSRAPKAAGGEDPVGRQRRAAVGVAVAGEDDPAVLRQVSPLARFTARGAGVVRAEED